VSEASEHIQYFGASKYAGPRFSPGRRIQCDFFTPSFSEGEGLAICILHLYEIFVKRSGKKGWCDGRDLSRFKG